MFEPDIQAFMNGLPEKGDIGVAVSGGGDSVALLSLMRDWAASAGRRVRCVTVNHGLRAEAEVEARFVASLCTDWDIEHSVLVWQGPKDSGNLQNAARNARLRLITDWAHQRGIGAVATGHTQDDQAETFLIRLKRGSGVDGLAALAPVRRRDGVFWLRPLLGHSRVDLREYLRKRDIPWVEDPSNEDERFDRVRIRKALNLLSDLGIKAPRLAETSLSLGRARRALEHYTAEAARSCCEPRPIGSLRLSVPDWARLPEEIRLRLLAHGLGWVAGRVYRPRFSALRDLAVAVETGQRRTLSGCLIAPCGTDVCEITRELSSCGQTKAATGSFDGRWSCSGGPGDWRVLGEDGLRLCPEWRNTAESRHAVTASPSLWYNNELKSAPFAGKNGSGTCWLTDGTESFFASILTH